MKRERFEAITDAIMAIIITLMALEINIPNLSEEAFREFFMQIGIYIISFACIAILWINHHHILKYTEKIDTTTIWINFFLLFATSLIPLVTRTLNEKFTDPKSHIFFASVFSISTAFYFVLDERAVKLSHNKRTSNTRMTNIIGLSLFLVSIPLSLISIYLSSAIFVLVPVLYFFVPKKFKKTT